jgi:hypothetical protein
MAILGLRSTQTDTKWAKKTAPAIHKEVLKCMKVMRERLKK